MHNIRECLESKDGPIHFRNILSLALNQYIQACSASRREISELNLLLGS